MPAITRHKKYGMRNAPGREWEIFITPRLHNLLFKYDFVYFCVGVMYSGEYDACDVTLSVYPHRASLKNMPGHCGNRTYDL